jgi:hypothetical protein
MEWFGERVLRVSTHHNTHDFEVKHKESDQLPQDATSPETGSRSRDGRISFVFVAPNDIRFSEHS